MKKINTLFLVLVFSLLLCGCGKSEAVKNVEAMIETLGEISLESIDAIRATEDAYEALTGEEQKKVKNYDTLVEARDSYYELALVGDWTSLKFGLNDIDRLYNEIDTSLNDDMTCFLSVSENDEFTWSVLNSVLSVDCEEIGAHFKFNIYEENDIILLERNDNYFVAIKDLDAYLSGKIKVVDLSKVDINDYCGVYIYEEHELDDFGESTGNIYTHIMINNKLFENGWYYYNSSEDIAIEVIVPEHNTTWIYQDGSTRTDVTEGYTKTTNYIPFGSAVDRIGQVSPKPYSNWYTDLTGDQLMLGRAKGILYFINSDLVEEVVNGEFRRLILYKDPKFDIEELVIPEYIRAMEY